MRTPFKQITKQLGELRVREQLVCNQWKVLTTMSLMIVWMRPKSTRMLSMMKIGEDGRTEEEGKSVGVGKRRRVDGDLIPSQVSMVNERQ